MGITYVMGKSALHKTIDQAASDLKNPDKCSSPETCKDEQKISMVGIDPGWIDTGVGKGSKSSKPQAGSAKQAAIKIHHLITSSIINHTMTGQLIDCSGRKLDW